MRLCDIPDCEHCKIKSADPSYAGATVSRVSRPRGELTQAQLRRFIRAENKLDDAKDELRRVVVEIITEGASFAEVSKATGLSTNTLQRWKREAT